MVEVYVSIGSNIEREKNLRSAIGKLSERYGSLTMSKVYESKAIGFQGDNFFNQVVSFHTEDTPENVAATLREIEVLSGRSRGGKKFSSRAIDLDLLLYDDMISAGDTFSIPRAEITSNAYVLRPLAEIAGNRRHPMTGERFQDLWDAFDKTDQAIWPVAFSPSS